MEKKEFHFDFEVYENSEALVPGDRALLREAQANTKNAYAPYSRFRVAAAGRLTNGTVIKGTNQENASFPAGICAERVLLSAVASLQPSVPLEAIAISYENELGKSAQPISPCGICRQSLQEYEQRQAAPIRLILGGMEGEVYIISRSSYLLPLAFGLDR